MISKKEFVAKMADDFNMTKTAAADAYDAVFGTMYGYMVDHESVSVVGFGKFEAKEVAARQGRNPQTGETVTIPAHHKVSFKPSTNLKSEVR